MGPFWILVGSVLWALIFWVAYTGYTMILDEGSTLGAQGIDCRLLESRLQRLQVPSY